MALDNNNPKLNVINGKLKAKPNINPFKTKHVFMASVLNSEKIFGNNVTFGLGKVFLQKSDKTIEKIELNFENNQNYIIFDNRSMLLNNINVNFQTSGLKTMTANVTYNDNTTQLTTSTFYVLANTNRNQLSQNIQYITATKPFRGYNEPQDCYGTCYGKGEYKVFLGNGNSHITKPFIIVDGFDPCSLNNTVTLNQAELFDTYGLKIGDLQIIDNNKVEINNSSSGIKIIKVQSTNKEGSKTIINNQ